MGEHAPEAAADPGATGRRGLVFAPRSSGVPLTRPHDPGATALAAIDRRIIQLFALVGEAIAGSSTVLLSADRVAAEALVRRDADIDALYRSLDDEVLRLIAEGTSSAGISPAEMRHLVAVLRILPELERSGDLAEHIALRATRGVAAEMSARVRGLVERMGEVASAMWRMAADAYGDRTPDVANKLDVLDDELDELQVSLTAELVTCGLPTSVVIELALIARFYERLGDHAVNIARRVPGYDPLGGVAAPLMRSGELPC